MVDAEFKPGDSQWPEALPESLPELAASDDLSLDSAEQAALDITVQGWVRTLAPFAATIELDPGATIEPPSQSADSVAQGELAALAALQPTSQRPAAQNRLEVGKTLGEGGMGIVRQAQQMALGRQVAVKSIRPERADSPQAFSKATISLLREAWITGGLEHPNIVPIYDIALDDHGGPIIVLKRIEGAPWSALLNDPEALRYKALPQEPADWNLQIMLQVCNAVHFAHSRGYIHRDLKPENIMVGSFGEVYVLDWGLALCLEPDPTGRVPHVSSATQMAGTPQYMAPEMLGGSEPALCAGSTAT